MCPYGGYLWDGVTPGLGPATIVCHCLLIEAGNSLVLVDTGFGLGDVARPRRLSAFFRNVNRVQLRAEQTARRQIERLGLRPHDVRHIVLTHLDFDHAGGIEDFPNATVHVMDAELRAATLRASPLDRTATGRRSGTMPSGGSAIAPPASAGSGSSVCANWPGCRRKS